MRLTTLPPGLLLWALSAAASTTTDDGLIIEKLSGPVTCDRPTRVGDTVSMHYIGTLQADGREFDQSYKRGHPFQFTLGVGQVIKGWDEGLLDMCIGEMRVLTIPPELGYGARGAGSDIPGGAILIFETKLMDIVKLAPGSEAAATITSTSEAGFSIATAPAMPGEGEGAGPGPGAQDGASTEEEDSDDNDVGKPPPQQAKCHLLGPFALLVQGALGLLAVLTLVWKRWREVHKRPWKIFFFDVSKQLFGSVLTHIINLAMSMLGSVDMANAAAHVASEQGTSDGRSPNPCSFYLLNLAIDTTLGVPVLYVLLKILHALFLRTPLANPPESIKSGHYDTPPRITWYLKQLLIYCIGLTSMKLFVLILFEMMPFLPWIGDWALRWTEGNEALQITFAMFVFPLAMNAIQYWVIDNFIMDKKRGDSEQQYTRVEGEDDDIGEERRRMMDDDETTERSTQGRKSAEVQEEEDDAEPLKEVNPTPIPAYSTGSGESSREGSTRERDSVKKSS